MTYKTQLRMTTAERAAGRFMRGPDHPAASGGGKSDTGTSSADTQSDSGETLTTEEQLEREFGDNTGTPESDDEGDNGTATDEDDDDTDEDGDADGDDGDESGESGSEGGKPATPPVVETEEVKALRTRAEEAEREVARVKAAAEAAGVSTDVATEDMSIPTEPDVSTYKYGELDQEYIKDVAKYEAKMEILQEQAKARFKVEAATLEAKWTRNLVGAAEQYPDFDEVVVKGAEEKKWPCSPVIAIGIKDSEHGPAIAYELAKNPEEATRISKLSPLEQAREFGRLEERQAAKVARDKRKAERDAQANTPLRVSKAPTPPRRRVSGGGGKVGISPDTDNFADFEKMADEKMKQRA